MKLFNTVLVFVFIQFIFSSCIKSEYEELFTCSCRVDKGALYKEKEYNYPIYDSEEDARTKCYVIEDDYRDEVNPTWGSARCFLERENKD